MKKSLQFEDKAQGVKLFWLCFILIIFIVPSKSFGQNPQDENFDNNSSFDITSNDFSLDGIRYRISGNGTIYRTATYDGTYNLSEGNPGDYALQFDKNGIGGITSITFSASDGSLFQLTGMSMDILSDTPVQFTSDNGGNFSLSPNDLDYVYYQNYDFTTHPGFDNISSFTITGVNMIIDIDDLDFESVVLPATTPNLTTKLASNISDSGVTLNGNVTFDGGATVTARGFVYSSSDTTPNIGEPGVTQVSGGIGTGTFEKNISGLDYSTIYYFQAYATNSEGTTYGGIENFITAVATGNPPEITSTPQLTVPYGQPYNYSIVATQENDIETLLSAPTLPSWLNFTKNGSGTATQIGNISAGVRLSGVAGDDEGNIYAISQNGTEIFKIQPDGTTTSWKSGMISGNVYALHIANGYIYIPRYYTSTNSITRVPLNNPSAPEEVFLARAGGALSLTDKDGFIYAAIIDGNEILKINETTKVVEVILNSSNSLHYPFGLTFDTNGDLYIATWSDRSILKYDGVSLTTVLSGLPNSVSSIRTDEQGNFYLSMSNGGVRKYTSDFSSFEVVSLSATDNIWSLSLTSGGALVYAKFGTNEVYRLQTGAVMAGTPGKSDLGDHPVVVKAENTFGFTEQAFTITVTDETAPIISSVVPANNATDVTLKLSLSLTFDEEVVLGSTGKLTINDGATVLRTYDLSVAEDRNAISISENNLTLSIDLDIDLPVNTSITAGITAGFVKDQAGNEFVGFTPESNTWKFTTVNKEEQAITFPEIPTKTYADPAFTLGEEKTDKGLAVTYTAQNPAIISISGNQATILKAGTTQITATQKGDATHLAATPITRTLTVDKGAITVAADPKAKVYGEEDPELSYQITAGNLIGTDAFTGNITREAGEDAGTYVIEQGTLSLSSNYKLTYKSADLVINKAEAVITADAVQTFPYDGDVKNIDANLNHSEAVLTYTPAQGYANAGNYKITVSAEATDNYLPTSKEVSLVIEKAEITGVTFTGDTFTYDGEAHSLAVTDLPEGATVKYENNGQINAGKYTVTATVSQENYNDKILTANLVINKAEALITADAVQSFTYDGTVKNVAATLNHSETELVYTPQRGYTNAGTHSVTISVEETSNYLSASKEVSLVIDNAEIEGVTFEGDTFTYDGTAKAIAVTGLPEGASVSYEINDKVNAGTYTVTAKVSQENYNDKILNADLVINKAEALITADAEQTFTYDGTVKNVSAKLNHDETKLTYAPEQGYTAAGNYPVTITAEETDNYLSTSEKVNLVIEKAEIEGVTFENDTFTYDGEVHSLKVTGLPEGATVKYENNDKINAGTYKITAIVIQENYNDKVLTADLTINKAEAVITADAVQTFTYDGSVKNVDASLNHEETELKYTPAQEYVNAGNYKITVSAEGTDNYLPTSKEVSLVIEKAEITGVTFTGNTFTYDGTERSIFVTGLPEGATVEYANNGHINAGTYTVTATVSQENYNDKVLTADLTINKAEAVITADAVQTFTYDGSVKNVDASLNHEETELKYTPAQGYVNAGNYKITVSAEGTDNYLPTSKELSLVIENAEIEGVTFTGDTFTYDGTERSIFVTGLLEGATVEYANNGHINAGTYTVTATVSQENYNDKVLNADLVINKAEAVITADAVQSFTYDGTVKNVVATLNHSETELVFTPQRGYTDAGTRPVTISAEETSNYLSASREVSLVIKNAEIEGVAFENKTFTYDGSTKSIEVNGLPAGTSVSYENNDQTQAGTYKVTATVSQENYNDKILNADLVINKAEAVITADAVQNFTYDGAVKNIAASLNHEEAELMYSPQQGFTNAGTYEVTISSEETDNYLSASKEVSLVIENAEITGLAFEGTTFTYDGTSHRIAVTGLPEGATVKYVDNGQINAGTYTVTATVSQENYNDRVLTADLIIDKAGAVITANAVQTFTYDGAVKNIAATLNHEEAELMYSPTQGFTNAGTYDVSISAEETDNYLPASKEVSLVIENADITGVTFTGDTFTYDGIEHNIFVNGLPEEATVEYANNGQINAGTYTVTATVSQENYNDKVLTANLKIKKAAQEISFVELSERNLQTDGDFPLEATSTSGLRVTYTYTYQDTEPAATVSPGGYVRLLAPGQVSITAMQEGNQNYEAATPVTRILKVSSSEARLNNVAINGTNYANPSTEIYYLITCGNDQNEVQIQLDPNRGSSLDQEGVFTIAVPVPGIYHTTVNVISEDGSTTRTYNIKVEKTFNFEDIIIQKFNNVLLVNNNPETNGGYKFTNYRWFKNGTVVGTGQYFSEGERASDQLDSQTSYYVEMTTEDGEVLRTCSTSVQLRSSFHVVLSPNPVKAGETLELFADFPQEELETMQLSIYDLNGSLLKKMSSKRKITPIELPYNVQMGVYILSIKTSKRSKSLKFIVR